MVDEQILITDTRRWLDQAVIGLNLCPFAKAVQVRGQIRYTVSKAADLDGLSADLLSSLHELAATAADETDTILLIHPLVLTDFADYNDYLGLADLIVADAGYEGVIQVASFHPDYQFADVGVDDRANYSNRSPYPMLHLLREESVSRAVDSLPDPTSVYRRNIDLLRTLPDDQFKHIWPR